MNKIKPRILPRSILDILICLPVMIIQMLLLFVAPMLIVFLLTGNEILALSMFLVVWGFFLLGGVRYLLVDENGILLRRVVGSPRFISWDELESVEISSPLHTIIYGWLWPPIPAREMTYSLSAYEHVQFIYGGGKRVFFPPKQTQEFLSLVCNYKAQALTKPSI
ncbi:MAG: hypothetical protein JKY88_06565 [Pseudomonadales bacterium]|nr:hypothetical protein [Pseudomonadales bacterium]